MRFLIFLLFCCILLNCETLDAKYLGTENKVLLKNLTTSTEALSESKLGSNDTCLTPGCVHAVKNLTTSTEVLSESKLGSNDTCLTPGCVHAASKILEYLDPKVEPCDDFYKFVCGNFLKFTVIPDDKYIVSTSSIIRDKLQDHLRIIIEEKSQPDEPKPFTKAKNFYKICMNETAIKEKGLKTVLNNLDKLGGWPVLQGDSWKEDDFDWKQSVYKVKQLGHSTAFFFRFSVNGDYKNNTEWLIEIDQADLGLSSAFLLNGLDDKIVKAYYRYIVDIAVIFGAERVRAEEELMQSLEFEIKLANISLPLDKRRNKTALYNPMTLKDLQGNYTSIPWKEYINTILKPYVEVDEDEIVIVKVPSYFREFDKLMQHIPKKTQANYVMRRVVQESVSYLTENIRKRQLDYAAEITGRTERVARWKECLAITSKIMGASVDALYMRKPFDKATRKSATKMTKEIQQVFKKILEEADWMDNKTKKNALEKLESMRSSIAYSSKSLNQTKLTKFYEKLEITTDDYYQTILNVGLFKMENYFSKLRKPQNESKLIFNVKSAVVNAFYSPTHNSIILPAAILQGDFFSNDRPHYLNFGAIGFIIGHEITHGFDDKGGQFDKEGNLVEWWEPETKEKFLKKAESIAFQYGNYTVKEVGLNLNGIMTQGENIADNGGIKESYLAYQEWVKRNGPEPRLPGLDYTPSQLFWISAAHIRCSKYKPESLKLIITNGVHSPGEFRVLGPFSNRPEFANDFNCPVGSRMNPEKKFSVW